MSIPCDHPEWESEQRCLDELHRIVAGEAERARGQLDAALADSGGDAEHLLVRESRVELAARRIAALGAAESGLCFGRMTGPSTDVHLGRIGLFDDAEPEPLLLDWRAPAARPFYCATPTDTMGIERRRHFQTERGRIEKITDEYLDADHTVDSVLMSAVTAARGTEMRDIVGTIRADQDGIIRANGSGILVIDGGPGTGKTSVALHRIAYLLYTERERLERRGVLLVGPNTRFLRYVSRVLPSLGETGVVFCTPAELYPGVVATATEPDEAHRLKGEAAMVDVLRRAVADRQELPGEPVPVELDDVTVWLSERLCAAPRQRARATGLPHNAARAVFVDAVVDALTREGVTDIGAELLEPHDVLDVRAEIAAAPQLRAAVDRIWPVLSPQRLLAEMYADPERIAAATPGWTDADRALLSRTEGPEWTVADVALMDEAVEYLGAAERAPKPAVPDAEYARGVLEILDYDDDSEQLRAVDVVDPGMLAGRAAEADRRSLAERALADREWTFGHVVVDEAQELSHIQWRVLLRRCPVRSMTVAGDRAQAGAAAGASTWASVFDELAPRSWRVRELHTNYRVPRRILELAAAAVPGVRAPDSLREGDERPWRAHAGDLPGGVPALVRAELAAARPGLLAVIAPDPAALGLSPADGLSVLTPAEAKGLEFDSVIVVEPQRIEHPGDLYVALTRPTRRLGLVHSEPLPATLRAGSEPLSDALRDGAASLQPG